MKNKALLLPFAFLFGGHTLYAALRALYAYLGTDFVLRYTIWFDVIDVLVRNAEVITSAMMIAFLVYSVYRHGVAESKQVMLLSLGALAYKYVVVIVATFIAVGVLDLTGDLLLFAFAILAEIALAALAILLAHKIISPATALYEEKIAAQKALGLSTDVTDGCYPLGALFSFKSPLNTTLFFSVLALAIGHAVSFLFYFIGGSPLYLSDIPVMLLYLLLFAVIPALISLIVARAILRLCVKKNA